MRWASIITAATVATALKPGSHEYRVAKHQEKIAKRAEEYAVTRDQGSAPVKRQSGSKFLNPKTQQFAVNGSRLPDVDFDIGESYAGLLPIGNSNDTEIFFWFFPSTNAAANKEIVLWFTGGPGCSSMSGLFEENGPLTWMPGTFKPQANPWSWHHLSNVVWIDQPIGTGYDQGTPTANNETDVADQLRGFWKNFVDAFEIQGYSVYITGESYGGLYCPYIAGGMIDQNDTQYFNVSGMIVYDGVLGDVSSDIVTVPFVNYHHGLFPFNDTFSENLTSKHESCGYADYMDKYLVYPPAGVQPTNQPGINDNQTAYLPGCGVWEEIWDNIEYQNPCFNVYQVSAQCPLPYDPLGFTDAYFYSPPGAPTIYFNRTEVKQALHVPVATDWEMCKDHVFPHGDNSIGSSVIQIPKVIEHTQNVQIIHGTLDMILLLNQTLLQIQNMTWNGELGFQKRPTEPLYVPYHSNPELGTAASMGVMGTAHTERGLTYMGVDLSGHEVPGFQPSVAYRQLEILLGRIPNIQSTLPFTTDTNHTAQPGAPMGQGNAGN